MKKVITKHMPAMILLPAKSADVRFSLQKTEASTVITVPTVFQVCMLTLSPETGNPIAADDNPMKLMSIAMKPLCEPPFPLEHIEEMVALMGGEGKIKK